MHALRAASLVVLVGIIALVAVYGPAAGLIVVAGLAAIALAVRCPEYALAFGAAASLAGGSYGFVALPGGVILIVGASASAIAMLARRTVGRWRRLLIPGLILGWLGLRVGVEGDVIVLTNVVLCAAALVLVLDCVARRRNLVLAMGLSGAAFILASAAFGDYGPSGVRFEGISGNPNRMTFGLLTIVPFLFSLLLTRARLPVKATALAASAGALALILKSGSSQGTVGLVVIIVMLACCWASRWPTVVRVVVYCAGLGSLILLVTPAIQMVRASPDLTTLSGRTPIYLAAIEEIMRHPLIGSGEQHFTAAGVFNRSAHSVGLALAATGGLALGCAWIVVLAMLALVTRRLAMAGNVLAAVAAVLIVEQFVQTIHLLPYTWALIGMLLLAAQPADLQGAAERNPATGESDRRLSHQLDEQALAGVS